MDAFLAFFENMPTTYKLGWGFLCLIINDLKVNDLCTWKVINFDQFTFCNFASIIVIFKFIIIYSIQATICKKHNKIIFKKAIFKLYNQLSGFLYYNMFKRIFFFI